tara:strand:- start:30 stop:449 length:420 start_codon:yes stop_codon:yes gene_type:complete
VNDWSLLFLAVTAVATGLMALIQIGVLIYGARLVRRLNALANRLERQIDPLLVQMKEVGADVTRAARLGTEQVERADLLVTRLAQRVEETVDVAQRFIVEPVRQGVTVFEALRSAFLNLQKSAEQAGDVAESTEKEKRT